MLFYSISLNKTLPFARVLSTSLKLLYPDSQIYLIHGEKLSDGFDISKEPFEKIIFFNELGIDNYNSWIFQFKTEEVCNAIQPFAMNYLLNNTDFKKIVYLNDKLFLFNDLDEISKLLDIYPMIITPYLIDVETFYSSIHDNESHNLNNGLFSPNFIALSNTNETKDIVVKFLKFYIDYTTNFYIFKHYSFQFIFDVLPLFYKNIHILIDPGYNVSTLNLTERKIAKEDENRFTSNGFPLRFFDFTGFETGEGRLNKSYYTPGNAILNELWSMYESKVQSVNSENFKNIKCSLDYFSNDKIISVEMRKYYRTRIDIQQAYPNPQIIDNDKSIVLSFANEFNKRHSFIYKNYLKLQKIIELILDRIRS